MRGSNDISELPIGWQRIVVKVIDMYRRIQFGLAVKDPEDPKERFAVECCQDAIAERSKDKPKN